MDGIKYFKSLVLLIFVFRFLSVDSQSINPDLLKQSWPAHWITCPNAPLREYGVYQFRKVFELNQVPKNFIIHISADNRYKFYVNGIEVSKGPARSDSRNWHFESVDIAEHLIQGKNALSALVWNQGEFKPLAQHSEMTGLLVQADAINTKSFNNQPLPFGLINTDQTWKVKLSKAYSPTSTNSMSKLQAYTVVGCGDLFDANQYNWNWKDNDYDDSSWYNARILERGMPKGSGSGAHWHLTPRTIPAMEEKKQKFNAVRRSSCELSSEFLNGNKVTIPSNTVCTLLVDNGVLSVGYPVITLSKGKNTTIELEYAEALFDEKKQKGNRNEIEGKNIKGYTDLFIADGGENREISTLWIKTFRYIQLTIQTKDEPLILEDFHHMTSIYPLEENAKFSSSDPRLENIWDIGWRTARLCALESYVDCPYYEQLQYAGDTRIQALITMYVDGDDRLVRKAITDLHNSMIPEGLTQSRYPSYVQQVIPPFSLYWVGMVYDHYMHYGDKEFTRQFLPAVEQVLLWFNNKIDKKTNLLGPVVWWNFVDWTKEWTWSNTNSIGGTPEGAQSGNSAILTLQYAYILDLASDLYLQLGDKTKSSLYKIQSKSINTATYKACYDVNKKLIANTPTKTTFSQHANIFGILSGAISSQKEQQQVLNTILKDTSLIQASYYFRFYLIRALIKANMANLYSGQLQPWHDMVNIGLSTFAEKSEPTRSDCHAWSASPNYDFLSTICGIMPTKPGFTEVQIQPALGNLTKVDGTMPHPKGNITVTLEKSGELGIKGEVSLPIGVTGTFVWNGKKQVLKSGRNIVSR